MDGELLNYKQLYALVLAYWDDESESLSEEEIKDLIYESYNNDVITGTQNDYLETKLEDGFE